MRLTFFLPTLFQATATTSFSHIAAPIFAKATSTASTPTPFIRNTFLRTTTTTALFTSSSDENNNKDQVTSKMPRTTTFEEEKKEQDNDHLIMESSSKTKEEAKPYVPPKVWTFNENDDGGNKFGSINKPTAGSRFEQTLPRGNHSLQLYSMATPNGQKITIMLEEMLDAGISNAEYDAYPIKIFNGDQFGSDFTSINPNSKIPALLDYNGGSASASAGSSGDEPEPIRIFESGSILLYLAEKFNYGIPSIQEDITKRTEVMNWLFWQIGFSTIFRWWFWTFLCLC